MHLSFDEVAKFFRCLRMVDDIDLALSLFSQSGAGLSEGERDCKLTTDAHDQLSKTTRAPPAADFARAAQSATGQKLSTPIVKFIFQFFDKDGDGQLHHDEFLRIMKDARTRGLNRVSGGSFCTLSPSAYFKKTFAPFQFSAVRRRIFLSAAALKR